MGQPFAVERADRDGVPAKGKGAMSRGDTIREFIWSGVITRPDGTACGGIMVSRGDKGGPVQVQATEQELHSLARMLRETAREVRRLNALDKVAGR